MKEIRTIIRHSAVYGSAVLLTRAVGFLLLPLYTRYLSLQDYGVIELLDLTGYVLAEFIALGIDPALMKYYHAYPDEADRHKTISTAVIFSVVSGLLFVALLIPARYIFAREILGDDSYGNLFLLSFMALFVSSVWRIERDTLRVQNRSTLFTQLSVAYTAIAILFNIYFVAYAQKGAEGIFYSTLITASAFTAYLSWRIFRETGVHFDLTKLRPMLAFGLFFVPVGLASFVLNFADRYFLRAFSTLEEVGLYALAYKIAMIVTMLVAVPFNQVWHSYLFEIRNQPNAKEVYSRVATYFLTVLIAVALGLAVLSREIIAIMAAPSYLPAHTVLPILLVAMVFFCSDNVYQVGLWLTGKSGQLSTIKWVAAIANLGLERSIDPDSRNERRGDRDRRVLRVVGAAHSPARAARVLDSLRVWPDPARWRRRDGHVSRGEPAAGCSVMAGAGDQESRLVALPGTLVGDWLPEPGGASEASIADGVGASTARMGGRDRQPRQCGSDAGAEANSVRRAEPGRHNRRFAPLAPAAGETPRSDAFRTGRGVLPAPLAG